jgi:PAS domain S-box-containing protein
MPSRRRKESAHPDTESRVVDRPFNLIAASREQAPGGIAHETGELHRLLVESVQDYAIFALDPHGFILSWNAGAQRFKGYTADEIIGKHFSVFYPPEKIAEKFPEYELREAARTGRFEDEGWRIRKDGTRFWASVVITALRDSTGTLVGYAKVTRDLTHRRAAEDALRLSEERFRLLVQGVRDYAIFMLDPQGRVATWNEGAQRIKQYSADEIIGKHFSVFYPPEKIAERFPEYELKEAARTGRFEDEGWRIRKDGTRFWANVVITALRDPHGQLVGFGKVTRDLTERRASEEHAIEAARRAAAEEAARRASDAARERIERLQEFTAALSAAHTIPEITRIIFTDGFSSLRVDAGALAMAEPNGEFVRLLGDTGYDHLPNRLQRFRRDAALPISDVLKSEQALVFGSRSERDARYPALAEVLAPYEMTVVLPLGSHGRLIGALAMHRRLAAGAPSPDALSFMESFAQQCGQALERAQLYEAEQKAREEAEEARARADEANRAKGEFLAAMSHELRTPLNAIGGYAELIDFGVRGPVTPEQHEDLRRIQRSQQHLLGIINDLLNFSRIDAGQVDYVFGAVPLDDIFDAVAQMIAPQAAAKGLQFDVRACGPAIVVWVDRGKTEQILLNLLSNAVKFTASGGRVTLRCQSADADVTIEVCDTGSGIAPEQLERIFEPFVQVGRSLTSTREGAGLGLAISRELARAMGGEISVTSKVDVGSTFTLKLRRA